jgi:hypothetical protein
LGRKKDCGARFLVAPEFVVLAYFLLLQIGEFIASAFAKGMDDVKFVKVIPGVLFIQEAFAPRFEVARPPHPIFWSSGSVFRTKDCPP